MSNLFLSNHLIAILNKVNELGERFGLKPEDFLATLEDNEAAADFYLRYDGPSGIGGEDAKRKREQFDKMLSCLGLENEDEIISGYEADVIGVLDDALRRAPRSRVR